MSLLVFFSLLKEQNNVIIQFIVFIRSTFPSATILVKLHLLEDHAKEWIGAHTCVGFGMIG